MDTKINDSLINDDDILVLYGPPPVRWDKTKPLLIFDLGGVLLNISPRRCMEAFEQLMGQESVSQFLGLESNGEGHALMQDYEQGLISSVDFVRTILQHCHPATTEQAVHDAWNQMLLQIPEERLNKLISLHAQGYRLFLLSNTNDIHWQRVIDKYPVLRGLFEQFFLSFELHHCKPSTDIFRYVQHTIDALPEQIIFIDDLLQNRQAAASLGWQTYPSIEELISKYPL